MQQLSNFGLQPSSLGAEGTAQESKRCIPLSWLLVRERTSLLLYLPRPMKKQLTIHGEKEPTVRRYEWGKTNWLKSLEETDSHHPPERLIYSQSPIAKPLAQKNINTSGSLGFFLGIISPRRYITQHCHACLACLAHVPVAQPGRCSRRSLQQDDSADRSARALRIVLRARDALSTMKTDEVACLMLMKTSGDGV